MRILYPQGQHYPKMRHYKALTSYEKIDNELMSISSRSLFLKVFLHRMQEELDYQLIYGNSFPSIIWPMNAVEGEEQNYPIMRVLRK